jgi:hypothetical protein
VRRIIFLISLVTSIGFTNELLKTHSELIENCKKGYSDGEYCHYLGIVQISSNTFKMVQEGVETLSKNCNNKYYDSCKELGKRYLSTLLIIVNPKGNMGPFLDKGEKGADLLAKSCFSKRDAESCYLAGQGYSQLASLLKSKQSYGNTYSNYNELKNKELNAFKQGCIELKNGDSCFEISKKFLDIKKWNKVRKYLKVAADYGSEEAKLHINILKSQGKW